MPGGGHCGRRRPLSDDIDLSVTTALQALHFNILYFILTFIINSCIQTYLDIPFTSALAYGGFIHFYFYKFISNPL